MKYFPFPVAEDLGRKIVVFGCTVQNIFRFFGKNEIQKWNTPRMDEIQKWNTLVKIILVDLTWLHFF